MTRRALWVCVVAGVLAVVSLPLGYVYWRFGGGSILIVTNVGREDLTGASVVVLSESFDYPEPIHVEALGTLRRGESREVDLSGYHDAHPGIRFTASDGALATFRIPAYLGGFPIEVRADVSRGRIERALRKRRRSTEYEDAGSIPPPR